MPERPDDGQPLNGPYDDRELPKQPETVDHPTCHVCPERTPRIPRHGAWICPKCDQPSAHDVPG